MRPIMPPLTPEEFAYLMKDAFSEIDKEIAHFDADDLMCDLLEGLGYKEGVDIFRKAEKWYA